MTAGILEYDHGQMHYQVTGSGEPIVFLHGFSLDHRMWQSQISFFSKHYQVITYDARGFGVSSLPESPYSHAEDLHALLKHLHIEKAHLVGLSMGGRIAINVSLAYPDMVRSLTLMDSALDGYPSEVDWDTRAKEEGIEKAKENWLNHEVFAATQKQPKVAEMLRTIVQDYSGWHWLHSDSEISPSVYARDRLHEISAPTLVLVGEYDLSYFHNIAKVLDTGIPSAQKTIVAHAGHMINMEAVDSVNALLANFLTEHSLP